MLRVGRKVNYHETRHAMAGSSRPIAYDKSQRFVEINQQSLVYVDVHKQISSIDVTGSRQVFPYGFTRYTQHLALGDRSKPGKKCAPRNPCVPFFSRGSRQRLSAEVELPLVPSQPSNHEDVAT